MRVRVLSFGVSKDWLGADEATVELPEGASVADLLAQLTVRFAVQAQALRGIAVSVNAEYAQKGQVLCEGDEVGLLPPVSGGCAAGTEEALEECNPLVALTRERIDAEKLVAAAKRGEDGAVVV
ncbi:MAG: MoaD/ThiS family protein, partial [Terracidiphilus sp.]|nr:MoaD/ThiS family protein [Terracidiphilus sp.]